MALLWVQLPLPLYSCYLFMQSLWIFNVSCVQIAPDSKTLPSVRPIRLKIIDIFITQKKIPEIIFR